MTLSSRLKAPKTSSPVPVPTVTVVEVPVVTPAPEPTPEPFLSVSESVEVAPQSTSLVDLVEEEAPTQTHQETGSAEETSQQPTDLSE